MAPVPTEAEIDAMSEEELEAYLAQAPDDPPEEGADDAGGAASHDDGARPGWLRATGSSRAYAWLLVVAGLIGIGASWELMASELSLLRNPQADLVCDVNPLVSCGASLDVWQGNLLGVPNSFIGAMAFAVLLAVGALLASGGRLPRWMWWGLVAGCAGGLAFVAWFLFVSVTVLGKLCPYCMVIWAVTIPVAAATAGEAALRGHLGLPRPAARGLSAARWWIAGAMYALVLAVVLIAFWDGWVALLR